VARQPSGQSVGLTIIGFEFESLQYGDFFHFSRWRPPPSWTAILDFQEFKFLMLKKAKRVELRHCAKFRQNRSNRGAEI